jgi:hypothetical protein
MIDFGYEEPTVDNCTYLLVISNIFKSQNCANISNTPKDELPLKLVRLVTYLNF